MRLGLIVVLKHNMHKNYKKVVPAIKINLSPKIRKCRHKGKTECMRKIRLPRDGFKFSFNRLLTENWVLDYKKTNSKNICFPRRRKTCFVRKLKIKIEDFFQVFGFATKKLHFPTENN